MRVLAIKSFGRFQRRQGIRDRALCDAVERAEEGYVDADLGGGLIKQRIARPGQGRSGGFRSVIAYQSGNRAVYLYGFAKSDRDNIDPDELAAWRRIGMTWLQADDATISVAQVEGRVREVLCD